MLPKMLLIAAAVAMPVGVVAATAALPRRAPSTTREPLLPLIAPAAVAL